MNSSELINSIEDAQVDELYEMDDWGKIFRHTHISVVKVYSYVTLITLCREFVEDLQRIRTEVGRARVWRESCRA